MVGRALLLVGVLALLGQHAVAADCVRPSSEVVNEIIIRAGPTTSSAPLGTLKPGQTLPFVGSVPSWYETALEDGRAAFVSKRWSDVVPCPDVVSTTATGTRFELHAIDVGTGLAVFVRGPDFTPLYDGGSNDDLARGDKNRLLAYLKTLDPQPVAIDHLIVSHPHRDHVELLPDVVRGLSVGDVWDSGAYNDICGYRHLLEAIAAASATKYHSPNQNFGDRSVNLSPKSCYGRSEPGGTITLRHSSRIDDQPVRLGEAARMTFLHVNGATTNHPNDASMVVRLDLGTHRVLLAGDAEAGGRKTPPTAPSATSIEGKLLQCCSTALKSDVLVVGHHGSLTSSRITFLDAVGAQHFIISSGPKEYGQGENAKRLPDPEIVDELTRRGQLLRTDRDDAQCPTASAKIGPDGDGKPGGCDNVVLTLPTGGAITAGYREATD